MLFISSVSSTSWTLRRSLWSANRYCSDSRCTYRRVYIIFLPEAVYHGSHEGLVADSGVVLLQVPHRGPYGRDAFCVHRRLVEGQLVETHPISASTCTLLVCKRSPKAPSSVDMSIVP